LIVRQPEWDGKTNEFTKASRSAKKPPKQVPYLLSKCNPY
jgi:hypothetical protein